MNEAQAKQKMDILCEAVAKQLAPGIEAAILAAIQAKPKAVHVSSPPPPPPRKCKPTWLVEAEKEGKPKAKAKRTPKVAPSSVKRKGKITSRFLRNISFVGNWNGSEGMTKAERSLSERQRLGSLLKLASIKCLTLADLRSLCNSEGLYWVHPKATTRFAS